mmetsp:Transcript_2185/g.3227  ORF Transcript_2185/g.3227 Transcript_2185/m.3227 type:complete len:92 (+) Transcript_2185:1044-1319(+)
MHCWDGCNQDARCQFRELKPAASIKLLLWKSRTSERGKGGGYWNNDQRIPVVLKLSILECKDTTLSRGRFIKHSTRCGGWPRDIIVFNYLA